MPIISHQPWSLRLHQLQSIVIVPNIFYYYSEQHNEELSLYPKYINVICFYNDEIRL